MYRIFLIVVVLSFLGSCEKNDKTFYIISNHGGWLKPGNAVTSNGVTVGEIKSVELFNGQVLLELVVYDKYDLYFGSQIWIGTKDLTEKVINITPPEKNKEKVQGGDTLYLDLSNRSVKLDRASTKD